MNAEQASKRLTQEPTRRVIGRAAVDETVRANAEELFRMTGTDLTQIDGIDVTAAMTVISEVGWDMSKWKTENHFVS